MACLKLGLGWTGPYKIINKLSTVTYKIQRDPATKPIVVHVDHLKLYQGQDIPSNWQHPEINTTSNTNGADLNVSDDSDDNQIGSKIEPYHTQYGRQIVRPDTYLP